MKHRYLILTVLTTMALAVSVSCGKRGKSNDADAHVADTDTLVNVGPMGFDQDSLTVKEGVVKSGQFFSTLLGSLGMNAQDAYNLTQACDTVFDVKTIRVGQSYKAYYSTEDKLEYLVYDRDRMSCVVFDCTSPFDAWVYVKPVEFRDRYADVTISSSLWNDMLAADVSPLLILSLSDIYAWTVDFFGLQKGDRFRVLYQEKLCDGNVIAVDTVRYAVFSHNGEDFPAILFDQKDGGNIWWNEKGESMRKAFLKAPLKYSRISSGFSYARRHPVTRKVQPHTGVDYAAPKGTPVMTIGDGVITSMKYEGAGGNTVRIRHNSIYSTAYLHLSKYAKGLKVGQRVRQGDVIGYVGSTGRSTGPHLDFRVWKNGSPINPLKMDSPPAEPLKAEFKDEFAAAYRDYQHEIDAIQARTVVQALFELL
ncbi:MAG: peptidoglycan DD-metalloendopeptidase family protein [Bacteroidales bacterium]|nr:peptidoglycan DD-metalloendopeptidase family protein [Bacteroidales bacterium]